jgi:hypothetical protein
MGRILKFTIFTIFCGLFLMQTVVSAQNNTPKAGKNTQDLELTFPVIEGWEKGDTTVYPIPELGYSIAYQSEEGGTVTIYVYNGGLKKISSDIADKTVKSQMEQAKNDIKHYGKLGYYENVKEVKSETVTLGGSSGKIKALHSLFTFTIRGQDVNSEIYLFSHQNNFIKIRATRPQSKTTTENQAMTTLLSEIDAMFSK